MRILIHLSQEPASFAGLGTPLVLLTNLIGTRMTEGRGALKMLLKFASLADRSSPPFLISVGNGSLATVP
jgi:hypothetical protein